MSNSVVKEACDIFNKGFNKQIILYGPPGTSKTYSAAIIAAKLLGWTGASPADYPTKKEADDYLKVNQRFKLVQFHPSYSYEDFVRGISVKPVNPPKKPSEEQTSEEQPSGSSGGITYEIEPKIIELFNDKALEDKDKKPYVLIIDEINRAPLASVLGELIYGLEYRGETFSTPYSLPETQTFENGESKKDKLKIAENLYIIGTMNTADRSIGSIDYAVRRRFAFIQVPSDVTAIKSSWNNEKIGRQAEKLYKLLMGEESVKLSDEEKDVFWNDILENKENKYTNVKETFNVKAKSSDKEKAKQALVKVLEEKEASKCSVFGSDYLQDSEMDPNDIKIGHTYFLGNEKITDEKDYLDYRIEYQIRPIYIEYIKDGLISKEGLMRFDAIVAYWRFVCEKEIESQ